MRFFNRYDKWPFVIGEYGPWDNDFGGSFTGCLFRWAEAHERVKMMIYYRGVDPANNFNLQYYPGAQRRFATTSPSRAGTRSRPG